MKRRRMSSADRQAMEQEALSRARGNFSMANFGQVIAEFAARGIPADEIHPKDNVFTFHAWRALGRTVRRGEHGVKLTTFAPLPPSKREREEAAAAGRVADGRCRPVTSVVFHISQTEPLADRQQIAVSPIVDSMAAAMALIG